MNKICCGFGNRYFSANISNQLNDAVYYSIQKGCNVFYTGNMGKFDGMFASAVRNAKIKHPDIKLICILPYLTAELQNNSEYYYTMYDDVIIPTELADIHYKSIIIKRNEWMINESGVVISHTERNYGGAYIALKYAKKLKKKIIYI